MNKKELKDLFAENMKFSKLPNRYSKEGLTPFNLCATFIACSPFQDAFPMIIAREDVFREIFEASELAISLLNQKFNVLYKNNESIDTEFMYFSDCYHIDNEDYAMKYALAATRIQSDIHGGMHKEEAAKILEITNDCMQKLFKQCIPKIKPIFSNHLEDLPVFTVNGWLEEVMRLTDECIALHNLVNPDYTRVLATENDIEELYPELFNIIEEIKLRNYEIDAGINIFFDLVCKKAKLLYPERSQDIDDELYNTDEELLQMLIQLHSSVQLDIKENKLEDYHLQYEVSRVADALKEHIDVLLTCYCDMPNVVTKYIHSINRHTVYTANRNIIQGLIEAFRLLDIFDVNRDADDLDCVLGPLLTCNLSELGLDIEELLDLDS